MVLDFASLCNRKEPYEMKMYNDIDIDSLSEEERNTLTNNKAMRENKDGKGRYDLLPSRAIHRLAKRFELGTKKYADKDHEKGIPDTQLLDSALRHIFQYMKGDKDEDHLIASVWNLMIIAEQEEKRNEKENKF
jgi:hypothetical protein